MIYTNKFINIISCVFAIIIFLIFNLIFFKSSKIKLNDINNIIDIEAKEIEKDKEKNNKEQEKKLQEQNIELGEWYIEIESINLKAPIAEGTDNNTLNKKIGHFEETSLKYGNIGLAAHNRGYENNFFQNLKKVKMNDKIIYTYKDYEKTYIIDKIEIIKNTDWSYLEKSEENKITLITCVENEPLYRRCVQGTEIEN